MMQDPVRTGIPGLDEVLLGGVQRNNNILVEGAPGAGKTTLGLAFIHAGAALYDEPGVIVSFELDPEKLLRDARGFSWDLQRLIDERKVRIIQTSPGVLLNEFRSSEGAFTAELAAIGARRLMIDGLTPLRLYAEVNDKPFREDVHLLIDGLARLGVTTLVTAERADTKGEPHAHERFIFDTIISLTRTEVRRRVHRTLSVVKSRGQDFISGSHAMRIESGGGLQVYRRAQSRPKIDEDQPTSSKRVSAGCAALDLIMDGGLYEGSITMVTGISGTGKTVLGVQFLTSAVLAGRRALLVTLDEHPRQLIRNAASLGFDLEGLMRQGTLFIHYESPLELELDVHFDRVAKLVEKEGIDCIVFDSVAVYEMANADQASDFLYALADFVKGRLATAFFNYESPELLGLSQISEELKGSHLVDNIILLSYVEISTRLRRAIAVPKVRGSKNIQTTREYVIAEGGISFLDESVVEGDDTTPVPQLPFSSYYGLLARSPSRKSPVIEDAVAHGKALPESPELPPETAP
ncbi:Circadian clock protein kinase KaiC [Variovorax sp. PBL-H6]|uniref:ATPase domain-containing protein n=1 Tax=Variovorax sp. PBL-H6 TaxID=434009 RepID=UPI00131945FC|nr:ATPase domain-containing protein [Variovorax sp. PBL-H6]VTU39351.1 Circadian clock protein kinase KaiC [Variovorax sp. PBL-H6]